MQSLRIKYVFLVLLIETKLKLLVFGTMLIFKQIVILFYSAFALVTFSDAIRTTFIECPHITLKNGRVRYRKNGFAQNVCDKGYLLAGDKYMKCTSRKWEGMMPACVRNTCKKQRAPDNGYVYPSHRGGVLNFFCKPSYEVVGPTVSFCDGTSWSAHLPVCKSSNKTLSLNCDFESEDICGWTHDLNHNFDWTRHNRQTPSSFVGTGPSYDHTLGSTKAGHYMYIEASSKNPSDIARLISPVYGKQESNTCLEFWYHMYGATTGELRVYLLKSKTSNWEFPPENAIFTRKGNRGNRWLRGFINLGSIDDDFQIVMEGVRGGNYMSDIAIDDITILENCVEEEDLPLEETTTTDTTSSDDNGLIYSELTTCYNRCGIVDDVSAFCSCSNDCFVRNNCCADYEAYCLDIDSTMWTTELSGDTTEGSTSTLMDDVATSEEPMRMSYANDFVDNVTMSETTTSATTTSTTTTTTTKPPRVIRLWTTTRRPFRTTTATKFPITLPTRKPPATTTFATTTTKVPKSDKNPLEKTNSPNVKEILNENVKVDAGLSKTHLAGILIVVALSALIVCVIVRKRCNWPARLMRLRRSTAGNSESDVRFLTSDEILDFSLASSYSN